MSDDKNIQKVEGAKIKKQSEFSKIVDAFVPERKENIGEAVLRDVIAPALKSLIFDAGKSILSMTLWGTGAAPSNTNIFGSSGSRINYAKISSIDSTSSPLTTANQQNRVDMGCVWFEDRGKAERALQDLMAAAERSKCITVADLYSVAGYETDNYQTNKYGWESSEFLRTAKVAKHLEGGWYIKLPKPYQI